MTFPSIEAIGFLARQHHLELIEAAAEQRLVNDSKRSHPSRWRRRGGDGPPRAA